MAAGFSTPLNFSGSTANEVSVQESFSSTHGVSFSYQVLVFAGWSEPLYFTGSTANEEEVQESFSGTHAVSFEYQVLEAIGWSIPLYFTGSTANEVTSEISVGSTHSVGLLFLPQTANNWSPPLYFEGSTLPAFSIEAAGSYTHGQITTLDVLGLDGSYEVRWSPSASTPTAPGSVQLTVDAEDLDGEGDGTIDVVADRGIVRYLTTGYIWVTQEQEQDYIPATLQVDNDKSLVVLEAPLAAPEFRLTATPDFEPGDMLISWNVTPSGTVNKRTDGSFEASPTVRTFDLEAHVEGLGYTDVYPQNLGQLEEIAVSHGHLGESSLSTRTTRSRELEFGHEAAVGLAFQRFFGFPPIEIDSTSALTLEYNLTKRFNAAHTSDLGFSRTGVFRTPLAEEFASTHTLSLSRPASLGRDYAYETTHAVSFTAMPLNVAPVVRRIRRRQSPNRHQCAVEGENFGD